MAQVEFVEVCKSYGETGAVFNVNLTVEDSEFLVLLGPSGCGKSTLLKMLAGLEDVTSGEIYVGDKLVNYERPANRDVAMVFQNYALYPHMSVYDNIDFPLRMTRVPKDERKTRVTRAAEILGLEEYLDRKPQQLSGGQRQRVALGRAIVREPSVFLMDEPLSNLDAQLRVQTREELLKLHERLQTTTIYVTHDQIEAMTMGHRIVVMRSGVVQQVGRPQDVYDMPANTFVAAFLGSPRINLHRGQIESDGDLVEFVSGSARVPLPGRLGALGSEVAPGSEVALGVRPEDISVGRGAGGEYDVKLAAVVELVEPVGSDLYVNSSSDGLQWMARAEARLPVQSGEMVELVLDLRHAHLFGPDGTNLAESSKMMA